ncbi:periplasmic copper-binding protein [Methanococcus maripaludis C5]|uniref:Periplasmic copper-binding protein n=1 Tax=Methanococcus maripaludis (strain C5 / ATCC BAA-1333) TaxID=402880 RepID=A4FZR1_METM5|nr:NosD domain-containing protein [Methanococcus maripaludis]ABO35695.1 periplasmic copper-binding protein [Methanococcus maripaludis C5]
MKIFKIFLLMVILGAISGISAEDTTIYVNTTHYWYQSGLFVESNNSIGDAVDNVPENGTVELTTDLNVSDGIIINRSDIVLDLKGNSISGNYEGWGITVSGNNVLLKNGVISNFDYGIVLETAENCKISNNEVFGNTYDGIYVLNSKNNDVSENLVYENGVIGIVTSGIFLDGSEFNNVTKNTVNNNIYNGIELLNSKNNLISGNNVFENEDNGIFIWDSQNNSVIFNEIYQNENNGILAREAEFNKIESNSIFENEDSGIYSWKTFENTISENKISKNSKGVTFWNSDLNVLFKNNFLNNLESGISIEFGTEYNTIYDNLFNNSINVRFKDSGENYWNVPTMNRSNILGGEFTAGNVWYAPEGTGFSQKAVNQDSNGDILSESYYELNFENIDYIPLAPDSTPPIVSFISPKENTFFNKNETVVINVSVNDTSGIHSVVFEIDDNYKEIPIKTGTTYTKSLNNLDYGKHTVRIYAEDNLGNTNSLVSRVFSISAPDSTPPNVKIISPTAKSYAEGSEVSIKVQVTDESELYSVYARLDGYNIDLIESSGYYINILDDLEWGVHTLWIFATDIAGNSNYNQKVTFEINEGDITPPDVEIIEPENADSFEEDSSIFIKVQVTDDDSEIDSVMVMLDGTISFTLTKNSGYYTGTIDDISYGTHNIRIYAEDIEENINSNEVVEFEIEYPDYSYTKPATTESQEETIIEVSDSENKSTTEEPAEETTEEPAEETTEEPAEETTEEPAEETTEEPAEETTEEPAEETTEEPAEETTEEPAEETTEEPAEETTEEPAEETTEEPAEETTI